MLPTQKLNVKNRRMFWKTPVFVAALITLGLGDFSPSLALDYNVQVTGSGCADGAQVIAVSLGEQGPDATNTSLATADSSGQATFTTLVSTVAYQIMATNTGCSPSLRDQSMDFSNHPVILTDDGEKTIALSQDTSMGSITLGLTLPSGSFPKLVMGGCRDQQSFEDIDFGMTVATDTTTSLTFFNMPPAAANTYDCGVFSPKDDRGNGKLIASALSAGENLDGGAIDLNNSFAPPSGVEDESFREGNREGSGGTADLTVVLKSTTGVALSDAQLKMKPGPNDPPFQFSFTDFNGVGQFFGLTNGTTMYLDIFLPGYEGVQGRAFFSTDWIAQSVSTSIALDMISGGGSIVGQAKLNGATVPQVWANCRPDFRGYPGADPYGGNQPAPGASWGNANAPNGTFTIANLPPGNYECDINSPFSNQPTMVNFGTDSQSGTSDDLRLTISTSSAFEVYNAQSGALISSDTTVTVNLPVNDGAANGTITGTLTFPTSVDLSASPITIIAHEQFTGGPGQEPRAGFAAVNGVGQQQNFTINVPTGANYFIEVRGSDYGPIDMGPNNNADLTTRSSVSGLNFRMAQAGSINLKLVDPNGYRWLPKMQPQPGDNPQNFEAEFCGGHINAEGMDTHSFGHGEVTQEGQAILSGLPSGTYNLQFGTFGQGCSVADSILENVVVSAGQTVTVTMKLKKGIKLEVTHSGSLPSGTGIPDHGANPPARIARIVAFPVGTSLNLDKMRLMHGRGGSGAPINLMQRQRFQDGQTAWLGLGGDGAPKVPAGNYTFYLFSEGFPDFEPNGTPGHFHLTLLGKKDAIVDADHETTLSSVFGSSVVPVAIPASFGSATLSGSMTGNRVFTKGDFDNLGGDFDKFLGYVPICAVYDSSSTLLGVGMGTPSSFGENERQIEESIENHDSADFLRRVGQMKLSYGIPFLPAGKHTAVCSTPNYPPVIQPIVVTAGQTTTLNINFDTLAGAGGTVSGVVTSTAAVKLAGVSVTMKTKTINRKTSTDANGAYSFSGLPDGKFRLRAGFTGYAAATEKAVVLDGGTVTANFTLTNAPGSITGTVVAGVFPSRKVAAGVKVVAYDGTLAGQKPTVEPPMWVTKTGQDGTYSLSNPHPTHVIKIFAVADGKVVVGTTTVATTGAVTAADILLRAMRPVSTVQVRPNFSTGKVDMVVQIPKLLKSSPEIKCNSGATYDNASATDLSSQVVTTPNNDYTLDNVDLPNTTGDNVCRVTTKDGVKTEFVDTVINTTHKARSKNIIDRAAITGGSANIDAENEAGGSLDFIVGSVEIEQGSIPTAEIQKVGRNQTSLTTSTGVISSDIFTITVSSEAQIGTGREIAISLPVDRSLVTDPRAVSIAQVINGQIVEIPDRPFYDPLTGTVTVDVKSIDNAPQAAVAAAVSSRARGAQSVQGIKTMPGHAPFVNGQYVYSAISAQAQSGQFLVISKAVQGGTYSGSNFNAYNFPNPFNLKSKTLTLSNGGTVSTLTTEGTILRYDLPTGTSGRVIIRIYTLSGDLVDEIEENNKTGGLTYYATWDGKNKDGQKVASGVYFAVFDIAGSNIKNEIIKMMVIK